MKKKTKSTPATATSPVFGYVVALVFFAATLISGWQLLIWFGFFPDIIQPVGGYNSYSYRSSPAAQPYSGSGYDTYIPPSASGGSGNNEGLSSDFSLAPQMPPLPPSDSTRRRGYGDGHNGVNRNGESPESAEQVCVLPSSFDVSAIFAGRKLSPLGEDTLPQGTLLSTWQVLHDSEHANTLIVFALHDINTEQGAKSLAQEILDIKVSYNLLAIEHDSENTISGYIETSNASFPFVFAMHGNDAIMVIESMNEGNSATPTDMEQLIMECQ